jgi:hypothetical protein
MGLNSIHEATLKESAQIAFYPILDRQESSDEGE